MRVSDIIYCYSPKMEFTVGETYEIVGERISVSWFDREGTAMSGVDRQFVIKDDNGTRRGISETMIGDSFVKVDTPEYYTIQLQGHKKFIKKHTM